MKRILFVFLMCIALFRVPSQVHAAATLEQLVTAEANKLNMKIWSMEPLDFNHDGAPDLLVFMLEKPYHFDRCCRNFSFKTARDK